MPRSLEGYVFFSKTMSFEEYILKTARLPVSERIIRAASSDLEKHEVDDSLFFIKLHNRRKLSIRRYAMPLPLIPVLIGGARAARRGIWCQKKGSMPRKTLTGRRISRQMPKGSMMMPWSVWKMSEGRNAGQSRGPGEKERSPSIKILAAIYRNGSKK